MRISDWSSDVALPISGKGFADFKQVLTDVAVAHLGPMGEEMKRMVNDPGYVDSVLRDGAERAQAIAAPILAEVYDIVRSEEHKSELQSLMRISYAVFFLKTTNTTHTHNSDTQMLNHS